MLDHKLLTNYQQRLDKKIYKTNRKDLDGSGLLDDLLTSGVFGSPYHVDYKKGIDLLKDPHLFKTPTKEDKISLKERVKYYKEQYKKAKAIKCNKGSYYKLC